MYLIDSAPANPLLCGDLAPSIQELRLELERIYVTRSPPSTAALGRTQQPVLCSLPLHPLPTHRIRIKIRTPHPSIPVHATREAVISATEPLPMPAMGDTGGGYMRSGRAVESPTTGASVSSPGHSVQTKYAGTPIHRYRLCCVCVRASCRGSCEPRSILCTAIHPISFIGHRTSISSPTAPPC